MSAILEIPEVRQRVSRLSIDEYHRLDEYNENGRRTELIRGIIIEKMPKSPLHCTLSARLYNALLAVVPEFFTVWKERPLTLADSEPEPDISVTRGTDTDFISQHPRTAELVIEIAVSNPRLDRENAALYAEAGIKEYWIVLGQEQKIEIYSVPENGSYTSRDIISSGQTARSIAIPAFEVSLRALFG